VGFIDNLPTHLIEAFKATLEEVVDCDLLIHVLDISDLNCYEHNDVVWDVLEKLNADKKPVVTALNKIDKLEDKGWIEKYKQDFSDSTAISALTGENLTPLLELVEHKLDNMVSTLCLSLPLKRMDLVDLIYKQGQVKSIKYSPESIDIEAVLPNSTSYKLKDFLAGS
jgi:GTP-binding protein HflX